MPYAGQAKIPRLDCLGLIEAVMRRGLGGLGGLIPRLDCLGLIEAGNAAHCNYLMG